MSTEMSVDSTILRLCGSQHVTKIAPCPEWSGACRHLFWPLGWDKVVDEVEIPLNLTRLVVEMTRILYTAWTGIRSGHIVATKRYSCKLLFGSNAVEIFRILIDETFRPSGLLDPVSLIQNLSYLRRCYIRFTSLRWLLPTHTSSLSAILFLIAISPPDLHNLTLVTSQLPLKLADN